MTFMKYYFENSLNLDKLKSIIKEWQGTPFRRRCCVKGRGVDVVHFIYAVLWELDLIDNNIFKESDIYGSGLLYLHNLVFRAGFPHFKEIPLEGVPIDGDLVFYNHNKDFQMGFYLNELVYGVFSRSRGMVGLLFEDRRRKKKMASIYRFLTV